MPSPVLTTSIEGGLSPDFDVNRIAFLEPRNKSSDTCICDAYVTSPSTMDGQPPTTNTTKRKTALHVKVGCAQIVKSSSSVKGCVTLLARVPKAVLDAAAQLDARFLQAAVSGTDGWFLHKMNPSMVEDFFRPSVELFGPRREVVARFRILTSSEDLVPALAVDGHYDLTLKLVGLLFRRQQFCAAWRIVAANATSNVLMMSDDDDESTSPDYDADEVRELLRPSPEDIVQALAGFAQNLSAQQQRHSLAVQSHKAALGQIKSLSQRVAALMERPGAPSAPAEMDALSEAMEKLLADD